MSLSFALAGLLLLGSPSAFAQETTAGIQGTVRDSSGGVVAKATVEVASPALIGVKRVDTDAAGNFRFTNLPPGTYTVTVTAAGFRANKQQGIELLVGHLPSLNVVMEIGAVTETVDVSAQAALIDPTQSKVQTNIPATNLMDLPTQSLSFQSVIQFAPGARSEPLQGGYQINGASNSENAYLVEGMETASMLDGHSQANVPMDFIQEVQVKTNGFEAEYGGALGGVVNVIQKSGSNEAHGSIFTYYRANNFDADPSPTLQYNPLFPPKSRRRQTSGPAAAVLLPGERPLPHRGSGLHTGWTDTQGPAVVLPLRLARFQSDAPRTVNWNAPGIAVGPRMFNQDTYTYNALARLDFLATQKIRLHGSWQYGYQRQTGTCRTRRRGRGENLVPGPMTSMASTTRCHAESGQLQQRHRVCRA